MSNCIECGRPTDNPRFQWCNFHFSNRGVTHPDDILLMVKENEANGSPDDDWKKERRLNNRHHHGVELHVASLLDPMQFEPTDMPCPVCGYRHGGLEYDGRQFCPLSLGLQQVRLLIREGGSPDPNIVNRFLRRADGATSCQDVT